MSMNQPTPEQIGALQQTNQFGGMGDPAMAPASAPGAAAQQGPTPEQAGYAILGLILWNASKAKELNPDVVASAVSQLASAYKALADSQQAQPDPQIQQQIDIAKANQEMQINAQKADIERAKIQHEMMLKERAQDQDLTIKTTTASNDERRKEESHKAQLLMTAQQQKHQQGINEQKMSNDHEIAKSKAEQAPKPKA